MELIIMRGLSGSGKSTLAHQLAGDDGVVVSADDFFTDSEGVYNFSPWQRGEAHSHCMRKFIETVDAGATARVILDNTNSRLWEYINYANVFTLAYTPGVVTIHEIKCSDADQAADFNKRNTHGVPLDVSLRMLERWEEYNSPKDLFTSRNPGWSVKHILHNAGGL